jgi:hypothetical protein
LTGAGDGPFYRAATARLHRVGDETPVPLDNLLIYDGPAVDFLDIAVWVSPDRADSLELSVLLQDELNAGDIGPAGSRPAGPAVAAVGSSAVIVNTAYRLLAEALGESTGLYRTSLLSSERLGVGRHPAGGLLRTPDYSFAYEVTADC